MDVLTELFTNPEIQKSVMVTALATANSIVANLATPRFKKMRERIFGAHHTDTIPDDVTKKLEQIYAEAIARTVKRLLPNEEEEYVVHLRGIFESFFKNNDAAWELLECCISHKAPPLDSLIERFLEAGYDTESLPFPATKILVVLTEEVGEALQRETKRDDSDLANWANAERGDLLVRSAKAISVRLGEVQVDTKEIKAIVRYILQLLQQSGEVPPSRDIPPGKNNLPYGSIEYIFKGRADALATLDAWLTESQSRAAAITQAVAGLGGIGKTRLAVEFAWKCLEDGRVQNVWFITARNAKSEARAADTLRQSLADLANAPAMNLPASKGTQDEAVQAVLGALSNRNDWLLIVDNVDDLESFQVLQAILPQLSLGHVLVTSRLADIDSMRTLGLREIDRDAAVALLTDASAKGRAKADDDPEAAAELADALGCLPVALEHAAAYIKQRRIGFRKYLQDFEAKKATLLAWRDDFDPTYPFPVLVTWAQTEEQLSDGAKAVLAVASMLAPDPIPRALFDGFDQEEAGWDPEEAIAELARWSMVTLTSDAFTVHRLVQDATQLRLSDAAREGALDLALFLLNSFLPENPTPDDVRIWPRWEQVEGHIDSVNSLFGDNKEHVGLGPVLNRYGVYLVSRLRLNKAEAMMNRAIACFIRIFGPHHGSMAGHYNNLGELYKVQNRLSEAEGMLRLSLSIDETQNAGDYAAIARDLNNLGTLLHTLSELVEAESLLRRAIDLIEKNLGPEELQLAKILNNLAELLLGTSRYKDAEPLLRRALRIDQESHGRRHIEVARDLNNLGRNLIAGRKFEEAEELLREALSIYIEFYSYDHTEVAVSLSNLAALLELTDRIEDAEELYRQSLEIDERLLGPEHPNIARDLINIANTLNHQKRYLDAEPLIRRALAIDEIEFDPHHPELAFDLNSLAIALSSTGRKAEAEPFSRRQVEIFLHFFATNGHEHPHLRGAMNNYAGLLREMGKTDEEIKAHLNEILQPFGMSLG